VIASPAGNGGGVDGDGDKDGDGDEISAAHCDIANGWLRRGED
jgi:hypothetical protein